MMMMNIRITAAACCGRVGEFVRPKTTKDLKKMDIKDKHFTIVYTVNDAEAFKEEQDRVMSHFEKAHGKPWAVTALSRDHEIKRIGFIEEALDKGDIELAQEIIRTINLCDYKSLSDFEDNCDGSFSA